MARTYGSVYEELDLRQGAQTLTQPFFFIFRRMMLAVAIVIMNEVLIWQVMLMASQIVASVIIIGNARPYQWQSKRSLEYFNEIILMIVLYTFICFSPFVPDIEMRFAIGYVSITTVCTHLAVNFFLIA